MVSVDVKPQNICALPFAKSICMLARFARKIFVNRQAIIGPFTGHLAVNSVISLSMRFEGAPVSRNSAAVVMFMVSALARHVTTGFTMIGQDMDTPRIRPVPMKCQGLYAVDMLYSGMDPALGRVWHRSVIAALEGKSRPLFTTGGFAMGPTAAFSVGTGYWWQQPFEGLVHLSAWRFHECSLVSTSIDLAPGKPVKIEILHADLERATNKAIKFDIKTPMDMKVLKTGSPMAVLGWCVVAGRMLRTLSNPIPWMVFKTELVVVMYSITEMPVSWFRIQALWKAVG